MAEMLPVLFGMFLILGGTLSAIDHPIIDGINRFLKSTGTTQHPSNVRMSETSALTGRILGTLVAMVGLLVVLDGLT